MATRTMDIRLPRRRTHALQGSLARFAASMHERSEARKALRRMLSERSAGINSGARI